MTTQQKINIRRTPQFDIFSSLADKPEKPTDNNLSAEKQRRFLASQPSDITIGHTYLQQHLEQADQKTPIIVADFLNELDWSVFETRYAKSGRPPYAPRNMVGLILYGIMQGVTTLLTQKEKRKKRSQKAADNTMVSPTEPEGIVQKMKRGRGYAPAYTPSVLANEKRVVVAMAVDPTNKTAVIPDMLDQALRTTGQTPTELLLDGGYANETVITTTIDRDISLLCPESGKPGKPKKGKKFHKSHFRYDPTNDVYYCPGEQTLVLLYQPGQHAKSDTARVYGGADCQSCPLKNQCTTSKKGGRRINRFAIDDAKDALRETMKHPAAKKVFKQRKAMVEAVFGHLRTVQVLNRFRRRGLAAVKLEFSLHLLAYNLSRVVASAILSRILRLFSRLWERFEAVLATSELAASRNETLYEAAISA